MSLPFDPVPFVAETKNNCTTLYHDATCNTALVPELSGPEVRKFYETLIDSPHSSGTNNACSFSGVTKSQRRVSNLSSGRPHERGHSTKLMSHAASLKSLKNIENRFLKAAAEGNLSDIRLCLRFGVDVDCRDQFGWTPLMCASHAGHVTVVRYLIFKAAADVSLRNTKGHCAEDLARQNQLSYLLNVFKTFREQKSKNMEDKTDGVSERRHCVSCAIETSDNKHYFSTVHQLNAKSPVSSKVYFGIPETNTGYQLLVKEGWNEEGGLGRYGEGNKYPIKTALKRDRSGLGAKSVSKPRVTHFQPFDKAAVQSVAVRKLTCRTLTKQRRSLMESKAREMERNFRRDFY